MQRCAVNKEPISRVLAKFVLKISILQMRRVEASIATICGDSLFIDETPGYYVCCVDMSLFFLF